MNKIAIQKWNELKDRKPVCALAANVKFMGVMAQLTGVAYGGVSWN
jgi:hypothetical protein